MRVVIPTGRGDFSKGFDGWVKTIWSNLMRFKSWVSSMFLSKIRVLRKEFYWPAVLPWSYLHCPYWLYVDWHGQMWYSGISSIQTSVNWVCFSSVASLHAEDEHFIQIWPCKVLVSPLGPIQQPHWRHRILSGPLERHHIPALGQQTYATLVSQRYHTCLGIMWGQIQELASMRLTELVCDTSMCCHTPISVWMIKLINIHGGS